MLTFNEKVSKHADWVQENKKYCQNEAATCKALIEPFIEMLGYDVKDPLVVSPEHPSNIHDLKIGSIDYAILDGNEPIIIIEAKHVKERLDKYKNQLAQYYVHSDAKYAILTNGVVYMFFCDLKDTNKMDAEPFFVLDLNNYKEGHLNLLALFQKEKFDRKKIFRVAQETMVSESIKSAFSKELSSPSDAFVRLMAESAHGGKISKPDKYREIVRTTINAYLDEQKDGAIQNALKKTGNEDSTPLPPRKLKTVEKVIAAIKNANPILHDNELKYWKSRFGTTVAYYGYVVCYLQFDDHNDVTRIRFLTTDNSNPRKTKSIQNISFDSDFTAFKSEFIEQIELVKRLCKKARS
jgi:hypothetical protein